MVETVVASTHNYSLQEVAYQSAEVIGDATHLDITSKEVQNHS
jgi:hypothetical protein